MPSIPRKHRSVFLMEKGTYLLTLHDSINFAFVVTSFECFALVGFLLTAGKCDTELYFTLIIIPSGCHYCQALLLAPLLEFLELFATKEGLASSPGVVAFWCVGDLVRRNRSVNQIRFFTPNNHVGAV